MTLISIVLVLLLEQLHALPAARVVRAPFIALSEKVKRRFNNGEFKQGVLAWLILVAMPSLALLSLTVWLVWYFPLRGFLLGLCILYLTIGIRHFSSQFTATQHALQFGEIERARSLLAAWRGRAGDRLTPTEVAGHAIARGLTDAHQHLFAPIFWFAVIGPAGALLYRLAQLLDEQWGIPWQARRDAGIAQLDNPDAGRFGEFSHRAFVIIDSIPARVTAGLFAIAGDFEDAAQCWRTQLGQSPEDYTEIVLAGGAGALGVRLEVSTWNSRSAITEAGVAEYGIGDEAYSNLMQRAAALVWRALLLSLAFLAVILLASWQSFFNIF